MKIENIGEKEYVEAVKSEGQLWVLLQGSSAFVLSPENGLSIPTWHSKEKADLFIKEGGFSDLKAVSVPIQTFIQSWLESETMDIATVMASPKYGFPALTYDSEEYVSVFKT